jgi:hypothetical protein
MAKSYEQLEKENEFNRTSFLQACRTLAKIGELLEIPEDDITGEPDELYEAIELLKADQRRINYIQESTKGYGNGWIFRQSITDRGMRLHETEQAYAFRDVRDAIDAHMKEQS